MRTLNPNNRNPKNGLRFWELHKHLIADGGGVANLKSKVGVGNNTVAVFRRVGHDDPQAIDIVYHGTTIARLYDHDDAVWLHTGGFKTRSVKARMDWALIPIGYRMRQVGRTWKVYSINTGAYRDYFDGMMVVKGTF